MRRKPGERVVIGCESHCDWYELYDGYTTDRIFLGKSCADEVAGVVAGFVEVHLPLATECIGVQKRAARVEDRIDVAI